MLGIRSSMCHCTRGFTTRNLKILKRIRDGPHLYKTDASVNETSQKLLQLCHGINKTQIRRFHLQLLSCSRAAIKNAEFIENPGDKLDIDNVVNSYIKPSQSENQQNDSEFTETSEQDWLHSDSDKLPNANIKLLFPNPTSHIHNIYGTVTNELGITQPIKMSHKLSYSNGKPKWLVKYTVLWPEEIQFTSKGTSKIEASKSVCLKILYWLDSNQLLRNRKPVFYNKKQMRDMNKKPVELNVDGTVLENIDSFLNKYESQFQEFKSVKSSDETIIPENDAETIKNNTKLFPSVENSYARNDQIHRQLLEREDVNKAKMPIFDYREMILNFLEKNQALVIKGDTGCGKTTQVPQFIMDYFTERQKSSDCNMIVTQPRRISAISLAERVAYERREKLGDVVGYQVRLNHVLPKYPGSILFCTTGILLKRLQENPHLHGYSHVILDEAHERKVDVDMLLVLLKRAILCNSSLKVIVMSATINAELFQNFLECPAIDVPGMLHPVKMHFSEDMQRLGIDSQEKFIESEENDRDVFTNCEEITKLVQYINRNKPSGAILCFLPGWNEISYVQSLLEEAPENLLIVPIHSKLPHIGQSKIFDPPPPGYRKVILATDIAETGITVPDVVYVIDSGVHRESIWNEEKGVNSMKTHWVSQANVNQRKGRAGRVQPGESYHFMTREKYQNLNAYPSPEIMRISLEKAVLDAKLFSSEDAIDFFGSMPQPPPQSALFKAVADLRDLGAFDFDENLTSLGKRIAPFSLHPKLAKSMVYSTIFECLDPIVTITSVLSLDSDLFKGTFGNKSEIRKTKLIFQPTSDHLAMWWIYKQWESFYIRGQQVGLTFCKQNNLHPARILTLQKTRDLNVKHLVESGMIEDGSLWYSSSAPVNKFAELEELVRGVLLSGIDRILKKRDFEIRNGRVTKTANSTIAEDGSNTQISPESVNYKRKSWPTSFLLYYQKIHYQERRMTIVRESSLISHVTALLFSQKEVECLKYYDENGNYRRDKVLLQVVENSNISFVCDRETAMTILRFRDFMWAVVNYYVENLPVGGNLNYGLVTKENVPPEVASIKKEMLKTLSRLLSSSSEPIDFCDVKRDNQFEDDTM